MKLKYSKQFIKDVKKYSRHKKRIADIILEFQQSDSIRSIKNIKELRSDKDDFRLRTGSFRIGFSIENDTIIFKRFLHRKDIYKYFP